MEGHSENSEASWIAMDGHSENPKPRGPRWKVIPKIRSPVDLDGRSFRKLGSAVDLDGKDFRKFGDGGEGEGIGSANLEAEMYSKEHIAGLC